ncbi:phosphotransferase [Tuberibacillus calidus]|jgi:thiamine kinase-like enzyme|uniref:phosphotransferase n=1 Tax=Tuberibacillus calidus TaxID=340097 RepID=UPI0004272C7F|nr:phosphotransferase [Tuberibacillus calidus]
MTLSKKKILDYWNEWDVANKIPVTMTRSLAEKDISVIKEATHRSIWRIHVPTNAEAFQVIVKACRGRDIKLREPILYEGLKDTPIRRYMPEMYVVREGDKEDGTIMFMECLQVASQKEAIHPEHLIKIAPVLARLHALTFDDKPASKRIKKMVPTFKFQTRERNFKDILMNLERAKAYPQLHQIIMEIAPEIYELAHNGFDFPPLYEYSSLVHGDLTLNNIGYHGDLDGECEIKFIDFGAAVYGPCFLDLVKLIESPIDHEPSWDAERLRRDVLKAYVREIKKQGIIFHHDPETLYKYAFLMRVFEYEFRRNLSFAIKHDGKMRFVFPRILKKINEFSQALHLFEK